MGPSEASISPQPLTIQVSRSLDIVICQRRARAFAAAVGFSQREQWELAIAVSEAVSNILKYAGSGELRLRRTPVDTDGVEFEAVDQGHGIADLDVALRDGTSEGHDASDDGRVVTRRGLGLGLGTILRIMDNVEIESTESGTCIRGRRWRWKTRTR